MANKICKCENYEEYAKIKIYVAPNTYYTYESLVDFDSKISEIGKGFSKHGQLEWERMGKSKRKDFTNMMRTEHLLLSYVSALYNLSLIDLAEDIL